MARTRPRKRLSNAGQTLKTSGATSGYEAYLWAMAGARKLDAVIETNLEKFGVGSSRGGTK